MKPWHIFPAACGFFALAGAWMLSKGLYPPAISAELLGIGVALLWRSFEVAERERTALADERAEFLYQKDEAMKQLTDEALRAHLSTVAEMAQHPRPRMIFFASPGDRMQA